MSNNSKLYPLTFRPIYKQKIWGGKKIAESLGRSDAEKNTGESWELSGVSGSITSVKNGILAGRGLDELVKEYKSELLGEKIYSRFGYDFPLLIKFIDAAENLSIQVHPGDELARKRHNSSGKTEMWYILESEHDSFLINGFKPGTNLDKYRQAVSDHNILSVLNKEKAKAGDVFFIPAGCVHAIGCGLLLAEIQQTSDITYRIYDWDRKDNNGKPRELHTEPAETALDFSISSSRINYICKKQNSLESARLAACEYFSADFIRFSHYKPELSLRNSFTVYIIIEGQAEIKYAGFSEVFSRGDVVLIPAALNSIILHSPNDKCTLLEIYI